MPAFVMRGGAAACASLARECRAERCRRRQPERGRGAAAQHRRAAHALLLELGPELDLLGLVVLHASPPDVVGAPADHGDAPDFNRPQALFHQIASDRHRIPATMSTAVRVGRDVAVRRSTGAWLRCALHAHTTNSDGELAPEMLVRHYDWAGYDVLAITDHWVRTDERLDEEPARDPVDRAERRGRGRTEQTSHVLALGLAGRPRAPRQRVRAARRRSSPGSRRTAACPTSRTPTGAACARSSGGTATACSGSRSGTRAASSSSDAATRRSTGTRRSSAGARSTRSRPTTRTIPGYDSGFAWTWVRAAEKTQDAVLDALRDGRVLRLDRAGDPTPSR